MSAPQTPSSSNSKKVFAGLGLGAIVVIILVVVILGGIGGTVIYNAAQQPNIHVTDTNVPPTTANPRTSTVVNDGTVANSGSFDYTSSIAGTYNLVFDNSFSVFSTKSVSVTYTVSGTATTKSFVVNAGNMQTLSFNLATSQRIYGTFTVSGGSGNDVDFYITGQTCTQTVNFSFTLVNSGSANGYATVQFTVDGTSYWNNHYYVSQGQQLPESGSIVLGDCSSHNYNVVVLQTSKT